MRPVGILTGLPSEAAILREAAVEVEPEPIIACSRASARLAAREADRLIREKPFGLVSFGLAGGLDPRLTPGTLVLGERIVAPDGKPTPCDTGWMRIVATHLSAAGIEVRIGALAGAAAGVASPEAKAELGRRTGALAVDMESHVLAARSRGRLPLLVLRAVADPADRTIPPAAMAAMTEETGYRPEKTVMALFRRPGDLPGVLKLARDAKMGLATLRRVALSGAPFLQVA